MNTGNQNELLVITKGVDYVGWHFYLTDTGKVIRRLRSSGKRRFKRRLKKFMRERPLDTVLVFGYNERKQCVEDMEDVRL